MPADVLLADRGLIYYAAVTSLKPVELSCVGVGGVYWVLPVRLSVRPSVCPVPARNSNTKKRRKIKIGTDVPTARVDGVPICQFERSKVKVTGRETSKIRRHLYLRASASGLSGERGRRRRHTRPLLGLLCCRRLRLWATGRTAAYHVGIRTSLVI